VFAGRVLRGNFSGRQELSHASGGDASQIRQILVEKAADLKSQVDETMPPPDPSPLAPDVERPA